jgi:hypothetical protein
MRNDTRVIEYLRLFRRLCRWWYYSESRIAPFATKSGSAR